MESSSATTAAQPLIVDGKLNFPVRKPRSESASSAKSAGASGDAPRSDTSTLKSVVMPKPFGV